MFKYASLGEEVQFSSVQSIGSSGGGGGGAGGMKDDSPEILLVLVFSSGDPREQFWYGQGCPLFGVVYPAFPLPITASPTLQGALKDMPKPCKFPFLDSCQRRLLWTHTQADLAPHPVVGLVLLVANAMKSPQSPGFKSLDPFFFSQQAGSMFHSHTGGRR